MEVSVKERLIKFLEINNISKSEFGRRIGVSSAFITSMRQSMQPDKVKRIALEFPQLNTAWLLTCEGSMLKDSPANSADSATSDLGELLAVIRQHGEELKKQGERLDRMLDMVSRREKGAIPASAQSGLQKSPPPQRYIVDSEVITINYKTKSYILLNNLNNSIN